jgi:hypothetical protein
MSHEPGQSSRPTPSLPPSLPPDKAYTVLDLQGEGQVPYQEVMMSVAFLVQSPSGRSETGRDGDGREEKRRRNRKWRGKEREFNVMRLEGGKEEK